MNAARHFLDTNILVYTFDLASPQKARRAEDLVHNALASGNGIISYQVAQEFISVARRLFSAAMSFEELEKYWERTLRPLLVIHSSPALFVRAIDVCRANQLSWYDALIVSAALHGGCKVLYSEDLQHGRRFGDLVVENPFL
jgi:predicted nucleic acid-binding protein